MATAIRISSSKYKDIISKSTLISGGCPELYQLTPKKTYGAVTRLTFGEKNKKSNKTILLVGETGAGKSALVNTLVNFSMGVKFEDKVWFQIVDEKTGSQTGSQTSDAIVYEVPKNKSLPYSLTVIDTPGYGSTEGAEHDETVSERLLDLFRSDDGVQEIHAVGLVVKASEDRLSDRLIHVLDSLMTLFGKDLEKNIVTLITHSDGIPPKNLCDALKAENVKCARNEKNQPVYFLFNNQQTTKRTEDNEFGLENAQRVTDRGMSQFTAFLENSSPQKTVSDAKMNEQIRLTACIQNLQDRIKLTEVNQREIELTQEALETKEEMKYVGEVYRHKERIRTKNCETAVCCTVCKENCHYPGCTVGTNPNHCKVMQDGHCTVCTKNCPVSKHVKEKWKYVTRTRRVERVEKSEAESLKKEMRKLEKQKFQLLDDAYEYIVKLDRITENFNSLTTYVQLDYLFRKMEERGDKEKVKRLRQIKEKEKKPKGSPQYEIKHKYEDIMSSSFLRKECPELYQLRPKRRMVGTLTRLTFGDKNITKSNKTILLVGETGAGKSALVNTLVNFSMGVKFEDEVWFQIVDEKTESQTGSQTSDVIVYEVFGFEDQNLPYSLTIIDTPGYGSTEGPEHDQTVSERLLDLFRSDDGVHEIHAVGLVVKASVNRLSDRLIYVFNSVMSLFGKNMEKNIVALITHSNGKTPENALQALEAANVKCGRNEKNQPVYFLFDNQQSTHRETTQHEVDKHPWDLSMEQISHFGAFLENSKAQKMIPTVEVLKKRIRLKACIQNLKERIKLTEQKQGEIKQIQETLKTNEEEMKMNREFTIEVDEVYKEKEEIKGGKWGFAFLEGAVCCTVCEENCHYPGCTLAKKPKYCEVMKKGQCTSCTGKCPVSAHVKENWKYVVKTRRVQKTETQMKEKYEKNKTQSEEKSSLLKNLETQMIKLTAEKSQLLDEAFQLVVELDQIALNMNSLSTYVHLDYLIEKMTENEDTEKVDILKMMRSRYDDRNKKGMRHNLTKFGNMMKQMME